MLSGGAGGRFGVAVDERGEDRGVALGDLDQRARLVEAREPQVIEHLVDDVDDAGVAGTGKQAEMEAAVEVQEGAQCRRGGRRRSRPSRCA